jgi:hypothetical protein
MACRRRAPHSGSTVTEKVGESVRAISAPFRPYLPSPVSNPNDSSVNVAQNRPLYRTCARSSEAANCVAPANAPGEIGA